MLDVRLLGFVPCDLLLSCFVYEVVRQSCDPVSLSTTLQVDEFLAECVDPILDKHQALLKEENVDDVNV